MKVLKDICDAAGIPVPVFIALLLVTPIVGASIAYIAFNEVKHPMECKQTHKVNKILELIGRDAIIELDDGSEETVNQATLKPGDDYCTEWGRKS